MKQNIRMVSLLGASDCNLGCSFCYLGKNPFFQKFDKKIKKAWETGEYLETTKKVLQSLNADPNEVRELQLWGGEPTLHLELIAKQGKNIGLLFPNIVTVHLPTNFFKINIQAFIDFMYNLDETLNPRGGEGQPRKLNMHLQASIDGPPGEFNEKGHKVSWEQYKNNFDQLIDILKEKNQELKNVTIDLAICPSASQEVVLRNLDTYEKITEFRKWYNNVYAYILKRTEEISFIEFFVATRYVVPRITISQETTTEEALKISNLIKLLDLSDYNNIEISCEPPGESMFYHDCHGAYSLYERNHECYESNENCITLLPDGTIAECPATFFHNEEEFAQYFLDIEDYWSYKSCLIRKNNFFNPLKNNLENEKDHDWYVYGGGYIGTSSTYDCLNFNMALELAMSWQIDRNYAFNQELLFNHYKSDFMATECYRENINVTHNPLIADLNQFRRWFNGGTAYSYEYYLNQLLKIVELETQ